MLKNIDRKGYPAYKGTQGIYDSGTYFLCIDHVQGDPFASPSKLSIEVKGKKAGFPAEFYNKKYKRIALCDHLIRLFYHALSKISFRAKGSGKSGLFSISKCGQEILERTACTINPVNGDISIHFEAGFPANGRTVNGRELSKMLFDLLPSCVASSLFYKNIDQKALKSAIDLSEDQHTIRTTLDSMELVAFIADGSILPRESGISQKPMKHCVAFKSPDSYRVSFDLPHHGKVTGMGIPKGITLIVGGGYHGKSTLLKALELGVYDHIKGDGRDYVITDPSAMKIRAEDGRSITNTDISMFINNLPNGKDTVSFCTEDASGSTSQAANVERYGISSIIVAGSCGSYFHPADHIIQMDQYVPKDITDFAKDAAKDFPMVSLPENGHPDPCFDRCFKAGNHLKKERKIKMKTLGKDAFSINKDTIDLRYVEQIADAEQTTALGYALLYVKSNLAMPRKQEIMAAMNRYRDL